MANTITYAPGTPRREDQGYVHLIIIHPVTGDRHDTGMWEDKDGGQVKAKEVKHRLGGMGPEVSLGGRKSVGTITLQRVAYLEDKPLAGVMRSVCGAADFSAGVQVQDGNGVPFGDPDVFTGKFLEFNDPKISANTDAAAMLEVVLSPNETIA